jgi:hypothetical protein
MHQVGNRDKGLGDSLFIKLQMQIVRPIRLITWPYNRYAGKRNGLNSPDTRFGEVITLDSDYVLYVHILNKCMKLS